MKQRSAVVTGGCGFIGIHCVKRLLEEGYSVLCIDNLSRRGAQANLDWITGYPKRLAGSLDFDQTDIRYFQDLESAFRKHVHRHGTPEVVIHEAAQVAVTQSVAQPRIDFETNALGTFNVLEAVRRTCPDATVIFASTNKVYGSLANVEVCELGERYEFGTLKAGISSYHPLDPHTPYGCSKCAADQYMRDYSRIYGLRTLVFRQSCVYGTRQFGQEDQGWVSWFAIAASLHGDINVYGSGKQLRDLLWIDDLLDAYWMAWCSGVPARVFNIGGGPENTLSVVELLHVLKELAPCEISKIRIRRFSVRPGDQLVYVSDISDLTQQLGWRPKISPRRGVERLWNWVKRNRAEIEEVALRAHDVHQSTGSQLTCGRESLHSGHAELPTNAVVTE
jgi:CDP-paratose 2-epimerase